MSHPAAGWRGDKFKVVRSQSTSETDEKIVEPVNSKFFTCCLPHQAV